MPTLYHSPQSRSSRVIAQLMAMGKLASVEVVLVTIKRGDGTGSADPKNPHPEGKVPFLVTDEGEEIRESAAIMMYLDELFDHPLSPKPGETGRGLYLGWMSYYSGVMEPAMVAHFAGIDHPLMTATFRSQAEVADHLAKSLTGNKFLLGAELSVADIIAASTFQWAPHLTPENDAVKAWVARVSQALDQDSLEEFENKAMATLLAET